MGALAAEAESVRTERESLKVELEERQKRLCELESFVSANKNVIDAHE